MAHGLFLFLFFAEDPRRKRWVSLPAHLRYSQDYIKDSGGVRATLEPITVIGI